MSKALILATVLSGGLAMGDETLVDFGREETFTHISASGVEVAADGGRLRIGDPNWAPLRPDALPRRPVRKQPVCPTKRYVWPTKTSCWASSWST